MASEPLGVRFIPRCGPGIFLGSGGKDLVEQVGKAERYSSCVDLEESALTDADWLTTRGCRAASQERIAGFA